MSAGSELALDLLLDRSRTLTKTGISVRLDGRVYGFGAGATAGSLEADLDMQVAEGRAALSKAAVPFIAELPEGVLKQLVIDELSHRTGLATERLVDAAGLDQQAPARPVGTERVQQQRRLKLSRLGEHALTLLLRQPDIANLLDADDLAKLEGETAWQILVEVIRRVQQSEEVSTILLLSHYQDGPYFQFLKQLAENDPMLTQDQIAEEFLGTLRKMVSEEDTQKKQMVIDDLVAKKPSDLTEEERQLLRSYRRGSP